MLLRGTLAALALTLAVIPRPAAAERETTREAFERLEEVLSLRTEDGLLDRDALVPLLLVSATPRYLASEGSFEGRALQALTRAFGADGVRICAACQAPRTDVRDGRLEQRTGPIDLPEIIALDETLRGASAPSRSAAWITETQGGLTARIVDLQTGRIHFAQLIEPDLRRVTASARSFSRAAEVERRARGGSLTHALFNATVYPSPHISLEWADQLGDANQHLAGISLSLVDPILGIGLSYHRILGFQNITVGGQLLFSIPTAAANALTDTDIDLIDPLLTAVGQLRWPIGGSNYAALLCVSTNGAVGIGISLLNTSLIPVLP